MKGLNSSQTQVFSQSTSELWEAISVENNLNNTHPFCKNNQSLEWSHDAHTDSLTYLNGITYVRTFSEWLEGKGYDLWIGKEGGPKSYVKWRIKEHSRGSKLSITVYPHLLRKWPKPVYFLFYYSYINIRLRSYLKSVLKGFKWYLDNGTPVPRNNFGKHSWFS